MPILNCGVMIGNGVGPRCHRRLALTSPATFTKLYQHQYRDQGDRRRLSSTLLENLLKQSLHRPFRLHSESSQVLSVGFL